MAFGDLDSSPALKNAINSSNAFTGLILPNSGWHLEILHMPITSTTEDIENLFAKYGQIDRIGFIHNLKEKAVNCYVSFESESDSTAALTENGRKVGASLIGVNKFVTQPPEDKGKKRMRTEETGGWGSETTSGNGWGEAPSSTGGGWGSSDSPARGSGGGGRGGRGGARGGGNSRGCFKCGEEGHMSRECPKGGGGGAGGRACFKCGEEGHMSRECPKGGGNRCFKCQEEGHISRDCPKGGGRGCFNCGEEGHMSRECSKPRASRGRGRGGGGNFGDRSSNATSGGEWDTPSATSTPMATDGWD